MAGTDRLAFLLTAGAVFLSPYNVLRHPSVYFTAADVAMLLAFLALFIGGRLPVVPFGQLTFVWNAGFLAIVGGMVIGGIASRQLVQSADVLMQYAFAMVVLPWVLCGRSFAQTQRLLLLWVVSMVIVVLHGIYLMEFASDPPPEMVSPSGRLRGVLERETELGALAALAVVLTMHLSAERVISLVTGLLFSSILVYGIILTASNTGILALAGGLLPFTVLHRSARHYAAVSLLCILALVALRIGGEALLSETFMRRVAGALTSGDLDQAGTFSDRLDLTLEGWRAAADHVFIGLGADGFRLISSHGQPVHNTYVLLLVEGGVLSLSGLCTIIGAIAIQGSTLLAMRRTQGLGAVTVAVAVLFAMVLSTFAHIYARFYFVPLVLVLSLAVTGLDFHRRSERLIHRG